MNPNKNNLGSFGTPKKRNKKWLIAALLILLLAAGGGAYALTHKTAKVTPLPNTDGESKVDLSPPTPTEKTETDQHKDELAEQSKEGQGNTSGTTQKSVDVSIVDSSQYGQAIEVRAFAASVVESDGSCTMTFTNGANTVTKRVAAIADASSTRCTNLSVPRKEFSTAGSWNLTVAYNSSKSKGSATSTVTVQ